MTAPGTVIHPVCDSRNQLIDKHDPPHISDNITIRPRLAQCAEGTDGAPTGREGSCPRDRGIYPPCFHLSLLERTVLPSPYLASCMSTS